MPPTSACQLPSTNRIAPFVQREYATTSVGPRFSLSLPTRFGFETGAYSAEELRSFDEREGHRAIWNELIECKLKRWLRNPNQLHDIGFDAPSPDVIMLAIAFAEYFRDTSWLPPTNVVPDPNGGIVFSRTDNDDKDVIHIWDDLCVEYFKFEGSKIVKRKVLFEGTDS